MRIEVKEPAASMVGRKVRFEDSEVNVAVGSERRRGGSVVRQRGVAAAWIVEQDARATRKRRAIHQAEVAIPETASVDRDIQLGAVGRQSRRTVVNDLLDV